MKLNRFTDYMPTSRNIVIVVVMGGSFLLFHTDLPGTPLALPSSSSSST
jgi:hypothetical protein